MIDIGNISNIKGFMPDHEGKALIGLNIFQKLGHYWR
jgi:hypothetical protein